MKLKEARDLSEGFILKPDTLVDDMQKHFKAKGFLEGWEERGEEVKELVETLEKISSENAQCYGQEFRDCWKLAEKALSKYREEIK